MAALMAANRRRRGRSPGSFDCTWTDRRFVFGCHVVWESEIDVAATARRPRKHGAPAGSVLDYPGKDSTGITKAYEPAPWANRISAPIPVPDS
jgi:hypothetical protein